MIIDFENIEDAIYQEIKEEMKTCGKFDSETCSRLTKESIRLANESRHLLNLLLELEEDISDGTFDKLDNRNVYLKLMRNLIAKAEGKDL